MEGLATWLHTPQKVIETCRDHMQSSLHATRVSQIPSREHPRLAQMINSVRLQQNQGLPGHHGPQAKTFRSWQCQPSEHLISSGGSCIAWVFFLEKNPTNSRWIFLKSNTRSNSANPRWTMHPCKASMKRARITSHLRYTCKKDMLVSDLLWPVVKLHQ